MKSIVALKLFVDLGVVLLLLNPGADELAQELQPILTATPSAASKLADFTADGEFYVWGAGDGRIKYGRTEDGVTLRTFYMCNPEAVALSPDGRLLAAAGNFNGCFSKINVWNLKDGSLLCTLEREVRSQSFLRFSPDGIFLTAATDRSRIDLWHFREKRMIGFETLPKNIAHFAFSSQDGGALVVVCEDGTTRRFPLPKFTTHYRHNKPRKNQ